MPSIKLTPECIEKLPTPKKGRVYFWDETRKSFGVRVFASGHKSFVAFARLNGRQKQMTIGNAKKISLDAAWAAAQRLFNNQSQGKKTAVVRRKKA